MDALKSVLTDDVMQWLDALLKFTIVNRRPQEEFATQIQQALLPTDLPAAAEYVRLAAPRIRAALTLPASTTTEFQPPAAAAPTPTQPPPVEPQPKPSAAPDPRPESIAIPADRNLQPEELATKGQEILWLTRRLKLPCDAVGLHGAPRWDEIQIRPSLSSGVRVAKVMELLPDLVVHANLPKSTLMQEQPGCIAIQIPRPQWEDILLLDHVRGRINQSRAVDRLPLFVGFDSRRRQIIPDLSMVLTAGATGGGKTIAQKVIASYLCLTHSPGDVQLVFIDLKRAGFAAFDGSPWNWKGLPAITDPEEAIEVLQELMAECDRRQKMGVTDIYAYNARFAPLPKIVPFVDELSKWRKDTSPLMTPQGKVAYTGEKRVDRLLQSLTETLRSAGVGIVIGTQNPSNKTLASEVDANLMQRIAFQTSGENESALVLNDRKSTEASNLLGRGDGIYRNGGQPKIRFQAATISDADIRRHVVSWGQQVYGK